LLTQLIDSNKSFAGVSDVQQTHFSLDGIARFVCNSFNEVLEAQRGGGWQFDVIIIGSGMYGSYTASKLFEFNLNKNDNERPRVLILDSGPFFISEHFQNLTRLGDFFNLVNQPVVDTNQVFVTQIDRNDQSPLQNMSPHHRCVGGKSLFWGGWSPRLTDEDLDAKDSNDQFLWPRDVVSFLHSPDGYTFIEEQTGVVPTADFVNGDFNNFLRSKIRDIIQDGKIDPLYEVRNAPIAVQAEAPASGLFSMDKFSSLPLLTSSIRKDAERANAYNPNRFLFLVPNAEVLKCDTVNGVVRQVVINLKEPSNNPDAPGLRGEVIRLDIKESAVVIFAGNTINSTRLALNSFPVTPVMGKNLMAHVRGNYFWRVHRSALGLPINEQPLENFATSALHIAGKTNVADRPNPHGQFHFQFYAVGSLKDDPEEFLYRSIPHLDDIRAARDAVLSTNIRDWIVVGNRTCGEMFGNKNADTSSRSSSFIAVNPFGGSGDDVYFENGQELRIPKAFITLVQTPQDAEVRFAQTNAAFDMMAAISGQNPDDVRNRRNNDKLQFIRGGEDPMGSTYHESGTLCMGEDSRSSVTDVHGHFHHVANAYCVDQSLFPTVGSANPVPTGLALSQMVARHLSNRLHSSALIPPEPGFTSLFDGSLNGWRFFGAGNIQALPGLSIIEAGTSNVDSVLGFLRFDSRRFKNFILQLDYKSFSVHANSGLFLRMPEIDNNDFDTLYARSLEIQIDETGKNFEAGRIGQTSYGSSLHKTGAVYGQIPATRIASKMISSRGSEGFWNAFHIRLENEQVEVRLNGEIVSKGIVPDNFLDEGYIAIQCHTDIVQFRNIRIQTI
jgi:hypothetical protein